MAKFGAHKYMTKEQVNELFIDFAKALSSVRTPLEAAEFIKDLLTEQEVVIFARRIQIARLLDQGLTYDEIHKIMKVGNTTVAKVHTWMSMHGEGFKMVIKRTSSKPEKQNHDSLSWESHKKKYPLYYWPELLLKEIVNSANKKQKDKLLKVVTEMKEKTKITRELTKLLQS